MPPHARDQKALPIQHPMALPIKDQKAPPIYIQDQKAPPIHIQDQKALSSVYKLVRGKGRRHRLVVSYQRVEKIVKVSKPLTRVRLQNHVRCQMLWMVTAQLAQQR